MEVFLVRWNVPPFSDSDVLAPIRSYHQVPLAFLSIGREVHNETAFPIIFFLRPLADPCPAVELGRFESPILECVRAVALIIEPKDDCPAVFIFSFPRQDGTIASGMVSGDRERTRRPMTASRTHQRSNSNHRSKAQTHGRVLSTGLRFRQETAVCSHEHL